MLAIAGEPAEELLELHAIEFVDRDSHRRPAKAAKTAVHLKQRTMKEEKMKNIMSFGILSST
ncbi:hypothetical protein, partial [Rhizobium brockwellii]|uniref:hypothetical protein n=1 Tax=Rhizobium brockwellii TaxID=3019932 RepID=UPI003F9E74C3